jgi:hypothetical protein
MINIVEVDKNNFEVRINSKEKTFHKVYFSDNFFKNYNKKFKSKKSIIYESFKFLLEREQNTSILKNFNIKVIKDYFPDYEIFFNRENYDFK